MGNSAKCHVEQRDSAIEQFMPLYYVQRSPTQQDIDAFQASWNCILLNRNTAFDAAFQSGLTTCESCLSWFYNVFYDRLFFVEPSCEATFKSAHFTQSKFLLQLVQVLISCQGH